MSATGNYVISGAGNVATLATDAAGNPAGLPNAANVLASAPSAMLYSSSGLLMCNGLPVS